MSYCVTLGSPKPNSKSAKPEEVQRTLSQLSWKLWMSINMRDVTRGTRKTEGGSKNCWNVANSQDNCPRNQAEISG